jgi:GxxExxY protein
MYMTFNPNDDVLNVISEKIIGCAFNVSNRLGIGFVEKVYENALVHDLRKAGLDVKQQYPIRVFYDVIVVGEFVADILVNDFIIVELKVAKALDEVHVAQGLNYLRSTRLSLCLLINFGKSKVEVRRLKL